MHGSDAPLVNEASVTPGYFHLVGIPLLRGRLFTNQDNENMPPVAVVNQAFVRSWFPNQDPLGKRFKLSPTAPDWDTVVGVIADARTESLEDAGIPLIYRCTYQRADKELAIFVRGQLDESRIPDQVRELVQSINPELPVFGAMTLPGVVSGSLSQRRFSMEMVLLFALTALLLAGLGIYGTISYLVSERTHEIGIRLALGANRSKIMRMILRQGLELAIAGAAVGLIGALIVSRRWPACFTAFRHRSSNLRGSHPCTNSRRACGMLYSRDGPPGSTPCLPCAKNELCLRLWRRPPGRLSCGRPRPHSGSAPSRTHSGLRCPTPGRLAHWTWSGLDRTENLTLRLHRTLHWRRLCGCKSQK